jgi:hypothetical protein
MSAVLSTCPCARPVSRAPTRQLRMLCYLPPPEYRRRLQKKQQATAQVATRRNKSPVLNCPVLRRGFLFSATVDPFLCTKRFRPRLQFILANSCWGAHCQKARSPGHAHRTAVELLPLPTKRGLSWMKRGNRIRSRQHKLAARLDLIHVSWPGACGGRVVQSMVRLRHCCEGNPVPAKFPAAVTRWSACSVGVMNGTSDSIELQPNKTAATGLLRATSVWGWNSIGIIALAFEGLLAFISLTFVGLITLGFMVRRTLKLALLRRGE